MSEGQPPRSFSWFALFRSVGRGLLRLPPVFSWLLALTWMGAIWWFSDRKLDFGLDPSNRVWPVVSNLAHAPMFGILTVLVAGIVLRSERDLAWPRLAGWRITLILIPVLSWAVLDEWHQSWIVGRHSTWKDVVMDSVGALLVLWIVAYLGKPTARERGLRGRLGIGVFTCVLCAVLTTLDLR